MSNKIALVTGATAGIGKVTALEIARSGASVVVVGRNEAKTQDVVDTPYWIEESQTCDQDRC